MPAFAFSLRPPRHPLLRALLAVAGLAFLGFFAAFGIVIAGLVLAGFAVRGVVRQLRGGSPLGKGAATPDPQIIDGEYTVVRKPHATLLPR